jgi:Ion channel
VNPLDTQIAGSQARADAPAAEQSNADGTGNGTRRREAGFRYGGVFALTLTLAVVLIASPAGAWSRAFALALEFMALLVVVATSRERERVRRHRALLIGTAAAGVVILVGTGALPATVTFGIGAILALLIPASLLGGLLRLVRRSGVNMQVVSGALAIYLLVGVLFAFAISFVAHVSDVPYFSQGGDGSVSERVYYSFTVLTTTGFGDFSPGHPFGRALSVVEMLTGQLYLVTVIGVLVGDFAARRRGPVA